MRGGGVSRLVGFPQMLTMSAGRQDRSYSLKRSSFQGSASLL